MVDPVADEIERAMVDAVVRAADPDQLLQHLTASLSGLAVAALGGKRAIDLMSLTLYATQQTAAKARARGDQSPPATVTGRDGKRAKRKRRPAPPG